MTQTLKKFLACILAAALLATSVPAPSAWAAEPAQSAPINAQEALLYLRQKGVLKSDNDRLIDYLYDKQTNKLTRIGETLYRYLKTDEQQIEEYRETLDEVRKLGAYTNTKKQAVEKAYQDIESRFGGIGGAGAEDAFALGAKLNAVLTGVMQAEAPKQDYLQIDTENEFVFADEKGVAVRMAKSMSCRDKRWASGSEPLKMTLARFQTFKAEKESSGDWESWECSQIGGAVVFNRELVEQQRKMNKNRPTCAPKIPETGRYNYEMLYYSYCQRQEQVDQLDRGYHVDRMVRLAQLLNKQYREDQFLKDKTLERDLAEMGRKKKINAYDGICGRVVSDYTDLVDCRLAKRLEYLEKAKKHTLSYRRRVEAFKGRDTIMPEEISGLQADEQIIFKYVVLTFLETQRFHTVNQMESLGYEAVVKDGALELRALKNAPDAEALKKALKDAPLTEAEKADYKKAGLALAKRLHQLMAIFRKLERETQDASHVSGMGAVSAALQSTQKQLGDIGLDYTLYAAMPQLSKITKDESKGVTPAVTYGGAWLLNRVSKAWKGDAAGGYLKNRQTLDKSQAQLAAISRLVAKGDFKGARAALIAMDPDAVNAYGSIGMAGDNKITDPMRIQASLRKTQETLQSVAKVHVWSGIVINTVVWSAALAIAAPVASAALTGVAKMAATAAKVVQGIAYVGKPLAFGFRAVGAIAEHTALRLSSLSPAADKLYGSTKALRALEATGVRFVNASARMGSFSLLLSGGLSGTMAAGSHMWEQNIGKGHSAFADTGEAFVMGYQQGAKWATDSWHPLLLYAGIPSNIYEGTFAAPIADSLATRGLTGNLSAGASAVLSKTPWTQGAARWLGSHGIESLAKGGGWRSALVTPLSMADNIAKFYTLSYGAGAAAQWGSYRFNRVDGDNIERRIKRAEQAGMDAMQLPLWLALPVYPAKYEVHAQNMQRSKQGYEEYKKAGELDKIANAAADITELGLKSDPKVPMAQKLFNLRWRGESGEHGTFKVTKDMKYNAIAEELPNAIKGAAPGQKVDALSVNPLEYYKISQMEDGKSVGRLSITDEVRDQAQGLFEKSIANNAKMADGILSAKLGTKIEGFGTVQLRHQEEVARILYRSYQEKGASVTKAQFDASVKILKPYLESEQLVAGKAKELVEALGKNPTPSKTFTHLVEEMMQRTMQWKSNQDVKGHADAVKPYTDLFTEFKSRVEAQKGQLSATENVVLGKTLDYLEAIQKRFQYFNRQEVFVSRVKTSLDALRTEYSGGAAPNTNVQKTLDGMLQRTLDWAKVNRTGSDPVVRTENPKELKPGDFGSLLGDLKKAIDAQRPGLSPADLVVLETAYKEIQAAPWMLHDSKGTNLQGWRPVQFEGLMYFLYSVTRNGAQSSEIVRTFLQMKTGAGKTLIAFEGLLPFADADAALRGKKTMFLTVQSNLESQARMEFRSLKKLATKMTLDTWEGFKTKIAEGKLKFHNTTDDYWILGDEMDGAALQPALTIGETTASVSKDAMGYRMLKSLGKRMSGLLDRAPQESQKQVEAHVRRIQALAESMQPGPGRDALKQSALDLLKASKNVFQQESRAFTPSKDKGQALQRAEGWMRRQGGQELAPSDKAALTRLVDDLRQAKGGDMAPAVERMDGKLRDLHNSWVQHDLAKAEGRVQSLLGKQGEVVSKLPEGMRLDVEAAGKDILKALGERRSSALLDPKLVSKQVEAMLLDQKSILLQSEPASQNLAKNLRRLAATARKDGNVRLAKEYEAQATKLGDQAAQARVQLKANAESIQQTVRQGGQGWELKVRELLSAREQLVDKAVTKENPIYEIFSKMRQDMYSMVRSSVRTQDDGLILRQSPEKAAQTLEKSGRSLVESVEKLAKGDPKAQPLLESARRLQTSWNQKAGEIRKMLDAPVNAEHQALQAAKLSVHEKLQTAESALKTARSDFDAAEPTQKVAMREKLDAAQFQVDAWNGKLSDLNAAIARFDAPQRQAVQAQLKTLLAESQQTAQLWKTSLAPFKGPQADLARLAVEPMPTAFQSQLKRIEFTSDRAVQAWQRRIDGVGAGELALRYGLKWTGLRWALSKVPGLGETRVLQPVTPSTEGLARTHANQLVKAFLNDPFLPPDVKWRMFWEILPSTVWPSGPTGKGSGWVRTELYNLARGYLDNPANIRVDNITGKVNVIHNGQWFESMDTPTRRYWELEYGTDLTLPYEHKTIVTMNDLIKDNHNFRFVGFSGTTGKEFYSYMSGNKVDIVGKGSSGAPDVTLSLHEGPSGKFTQVGDAMRAANQSPEALVVLSVSDTKMVKAVRNYLIKAGLVKPENIAMVFSDSELLRLNRPQANVSQQMNLDGLTSGKVKILILDTRVGGRGLDLNFKGERGKPGGFGGYKKMEMLILDPQEMTGVHNIQAQGRIDLGRVLPGTERVFKLVMDVRTAQGDPVFLKMMREEPIMQQLSQSPEAKALALKQGKLYADWTVVHDYVRELEGRQASPDLTRLYRQTVDKYLVMKQDVVELEQLRSASVIQDANRVPNPLFRGLEGR
ncbi:MAG TPA: hypothetical protein DCM05_03740 [Elusimicrobia bacterium]|nr:hypothetical protein [Elusimicrobiota bacterium]